MTTTIVLVRHGATEWNETRRAQGQADVPLSDKGRREASRIAHDLADLDVSGVYSSDLSRAVETARQIAVRHGVEVVTDPRLREIDQGEWTGLGTDEIRRRWPDLWGRARHYSARPGGETPADVRRRALAALADVARAHPEQMVVVVSHGGTIRWLSAEALGYDDRDSAHIRGLANAGAVSVQADADGDRVRLHDLARLDGSSTDVDDPNQ